MPRHSRTAAVYIRLAVSAVDERGDGSDDIIPVGVNSSEEGYEGLRGEARIVRGFVLRDHHNRGIGFIFRVFV